MSQDIEQKLIDEENIENLSIQDLKLEHKTSSNDSSSINESSFSIFKKIALGTFKLSISFLMNSLMRNIILIFLQGESSSVQAAVALGSSMMNIFGMAIFIGLNQGLMNRLSHAYGAKNYKLMGLYLHRGLIINFFLVIFSSTLVFFSPYMFQHFGYDQELLDDMTDYIRIGMFSFIGTGIWQVFSNYLNAMKIFDIGSYIMIFNSVICIISAYLLIIQFGMGLTGAAIAQVLGQILGAIIIFIYCYRANMKDTIFKFEKNSFKGIWDLFKFQVVAGSQIFFEWSGYEVMILFSGTLAVDQVAALVLSLNIDSLIFGTAISANITTASYIGNFMGAKLASKAKRYLKISTYFILGFSFVMDVLIFFFNGELAELYSDDEDTQYYISQILKIFMILIPIDNLQGSYSGVLRSIRKEKQGAKITLVNMYVFALPTAFLLVLFTDLQIYGIVFAMCFMVSLNLVGYTYHIFRTDWEKQSQIISENLDEDDEKIEDSQETDTGERRESSGLRNISSDE